jgi:hypothetical protein
MVSLKFQDFVVNAENLNLVITVALNPISAAHMSSFLSTPILLFRVIDINHIKESIPLVKQ